MPLDSVPIESTVEFAAASHLDNKWYKPRKFATHLNYNTHDNEVCDTNEYIDVPSDQYIRENYRILRFSVEPGDCIVFHMRTLHGAPGNLSQTTSRRVLSTRWLGM
jgi:ectoine hydroxylase-related dioxygenase (phytanoyl-CoA dioxygenase family)